MPRELRLALRGRTVSASFTRPDFQRRKDRPEHQVQRLFARWGRRVSSGFVRALSARNRSGPGPTAGHTGRTTDGNPHACERRGQRLLSASRSRSAASDHQRNSAQPRKIRSSLPSCVCSTALATTLDVLQARQVLDAANAQIPDLERQIGQTEDAINILLGKYPDNVPRGNALGH